MTGGGTPVENAVKRAQGHFRGLSPRPARWIVPLMIALLTVGAFLPTLQSGFVNWDDNKFLIHNPSYRGLGWTQLKWMFTTFHQGLYQPLSWMTYGMDYLVWGMSPIGYHLTNLLLHAGTAVVFYCVTIRLLQLAMADSAENSDIGIYPAATFAALLFSLHPLRVESVAWATERRDVLSGLLYLLTLLVYLRACATSPEGRARLRWLAASLGLYALALMSKAMAVSLPVILVVLDVYPLRRLGGGSGRWMGPAVRHVWLEKVPFSLLALATVVTAVIAQAENSNLKPIEQHGIAARLAIALFGTAFYLWKTVVPIGLSPLYQLPTHVNPLEWQFVLSGAATMAISGALIVARRRWPAGLALWISYVVILLPVLGIVQVGPQIAADRYTYLSCLGWAVLAGAGLLTARRAWSRGAISQPIAATIAGLAIVVLAGLWGSTWRQTQIWHDSARLWTHAIAVNPNSSTAHLNLGDALAASGQLASAKEQFASALRLDPTMRVARLNIAVVYEKEKKVEQAEAEYRRLLEQEPTYIKGYLQLGQLYQKLGRIEDWTALFQRALLIEPKNPTILSNLAVGYLSQGRMQEGVTLLEKAVALDPGNAALHYNLGLAYQQAGRADLATSAFQKARSLDATIAANPQ